VIEPTPRFKQRRPNWTRTRLLTFEGDARSPIDSVRVTGFLFYDPFHPEHLNRYRRTLWEIHPITRIEFFQNGVWTNLHQQN
jgi:hypothetical protein